MDFIQSFRSYPFKWILPSQKLIEKESEAVVVKRVVVALLADKFWRDVLITATNFSQKHRRIILTSITEIA